MSSPSSNTLSSLVWPGEAFTRATNGSKTIGQFVHHMRNSVAHGYVTFSSDSRELAEVMLSFEDRPKKKLPPTWRMCLNGNDLRRVCDILMELAEDAVG